MKNNKSTKKDTVVPPEEPEEVFVDPTTLEEVSAFFDQMRFAEMQSEIAQCAEATLNQVQDED